MVDLSPFDCALLNMLQNGIPVVANPFAEVAETLGCSEATVVARIQALLDAGVLSRFGPMFDAERMGGAFTLCAMEVPAASFETVASTVNAHPEVAHNYARRHRLNMWFVLASERPERLPEVIAEIEKETGIAVLDLPKLDEFYVGLKFSLAHEVAVP